MIEQQYIKLFELRNVTQSEGETVSCVLERSGGEGTTEEMVKVNEGVFRHFIKENIKLEEEMETLKKDNDVLAKENKKISAFLRALEAAGVDNWSGYDQAQEIYKEDYND